MVYGRKKAGATATRVSLSKWILYALGVGEEAAPDQTKKEVPQSSYNLLGHLSKLPAKISILELLKTYPKHQEM